MDSFQICFLPLSQENMRLLEPHAQLWAAWNEADLEKMRAIVLQTPLEDRAALITYNKGELLRDICADRDLDTLQFIHSLLVEYGGSLDMTDEFNQTALHQACLNADEEITEALLELGASVNAQDDTLYTPLHFSCWYGHDGITRMLLANGADVDAKAKGELTPLHLACVDNHATTAVTLIENSADIDAKDDKGFTPLHCACQRGHAQTVAMLIQQGAALDSINKFGQTPLALAVEHDEDRYQETVLKMIQAGAEAIMMYQTRWVRNRTLAQVHRAWMLEHLWSLADDLWRLELAETDRCERTPIAVAVCLLVRNVSEEDTLKAAWWKCIVKWSYQSLLDVRA
eukprot:TRINITY_DN10150_c0_g1_i14.p1 TRINITY_DN10150_c0_g1~~TRINITY_DN10150_c0_g1_i14.p1  ORF type:complete len:343 (+),score=55.20 TRINITY_DN10150_c0_g1_i14:58-1086(+)